MEKPAPASQVVRVCHITITVCWNLRSTIMGCSLMSDVHKEFQQNLSSSLNMKSRKHRRYVAISFTKLNSKSKHCLKSL
jgi:hypothetical protein